MATNTEVKYTTPAGLEVAPPPHLNKPKSQYTIFHFANGLIFILVCLIILVPIWKVLIDSLDLTTGYGMKLLPSKFGLDGYMSIFSNQSLLQPLWVSIYTTVAGTFIGLLLSTLGAYVLIQWDMPGRTLLANILLFTMIFSGGMIPSYLVMRAIHLTDNPLGPILLPAINVYNLVLMRNFFEGIPHSLFESADLDGCSPMGMFWRIALPLSKAALASIGLMFAVAYWNDYTNFKLYITDRSLYNFQMKLRDMMQSSDLPESIGGATENTIRNACIITAILPFMVLYPFLQKYFVKGINIGAVKE
ncbi:MAG: carbohydrate ABC transporter permease [Clostridiales bacterium]|nr:carbohydrate ABC transporter permease [Clostridiales bacterium]